MVPTQRGRPRGTYDDTDVDHIVIERATTGTRPTAMTYSERIVAVHRFHHQGLGAGTIAARLHRSGTRVHELLQRQPRHPPNSTTLPAVAHQHPATQASTAKEQQQ